MLPLTAAPSVAAEAAPQAVTACTVLQFRLEELGFSMSTADFRVIWLMAPLGGHMQLGRPGQDFFRDLDPATQPISQLWRFCTDLSSSHVTRHRILERAVEFPAVNPNFAGACLTNLATDSNVAYCLHANATHMRLDASLSQPAASTSTEQSILQLHKD